MVRASSGLGDAAADDGVDVDVKVGVLGEHLEFPVEDLEALLRDVVGHDVVDGDLHVIESGLVQALDAIGHQEVAVGDHAGDGAGFADAGDDVVEVGVQQRLSAGDGDDGGSEAAEVVDAAEHFVERYGVGEVVEFVAIGAGEIAAAHGDDVRHVGVVGRAEGVADGADLAGLAAHGEPSPPERHGAGHGRQGSL